MAIEAAFAVPHPPLIIPAVGRGEERAIQTTIDAYDEVARRVAVCEPELVIVSSPHAPAYRDWFHVSSGAGATGDMLEYRAHDTDLSCAYDVEFVEHLARLASENDFPAGPTRERTRKLDHATYIPLWFINKCWTNYKVVRVGLSGFGPLEHYRFGQLLARCVDELGLRCVYIASGDLSHKLKDDGPYGFAPQGPVFDERVTQALAHGDFLQVLSFDESFTEKAAECGLRSFQIMAGALDGKALDSELLSYEGPFGVGYGVAAFQVVADDPSRCFGEQFREQARREIADSRAGEDAYIQLARHTVEQFVRGTADKFDESLPEEMLAERAGVFVSLHRHGRLRGCIGTTSAFTACIADEIRHNAISACSEDPRFEPVRVDELDELEISVDVLGAAERIDSADELDPQRYGVIVANGARRGLLLPNLDGIDTVAEQVAIAKRKAGIADYEECSLQRFEVVRHEVVQ